MVGPGLRGTSRGGIHALLEALFRAAVRETFHACEGVAAREGTQHTGDSFLFEGCGSGFS